MIGGSLKSLRKVANMDCEFILDILVIRSPLSAWSLASSSMYFEQLSKLIFAASFSFSDIFCGFCCESLASAVGPFWVTSGATLASGFAETCWVRLEAYMLHELLVCDGQKRMKGLLDVNLSVFPFEVGSCQSNFG